VFSALHTNTGRFVIFCGLFLASMIAAVAFEAWYLIAIPFGALFFYFGWNHINLIFFLLLI